MLLQPVPCEGWVCTPQLGGTPGSAAGRGNSAHPQLGFLLFLWSGVQFALHLVGNACTLAQPLLQGRLVPPGSGRQGLTSAYSLLTADSGAAAVHEFCRLSETLHLIGNI